MDDHDFELVVRDLDELFGSDDLGLLSPLPSTSLDPFSAALFGELEAPLPISLVGVVSNETMQTQGTVSPSTSTHSSQSCASTAAGSDTDATAEDVKRRLAGYTYPLRRRVTMKERIRVLQSEASQLAIELKDAQRRAQATARTRRASKAGEAKCAKNANQPMWEPIAVRQQIYREKAEAENENLRRLVESQTRYLRGVQRAIRKQPDREEADRVANALTTVNRQRVLQAEGANTFKMLLSRLDDQYARVDHIWTSHGISDLPCPGRRCLTNSQSIREEVRIELINRTQMPFEMEAVEKVVWKYLADTRLRLPAVQEAKLVDYRDNTIQINLTMKNNYDGFQTINTTSSVTRKFTERGRVVFVSLSLTEPLVQNHVPAEGIKFFTTAIRILNLGDALPDGSGSTVLESFWSTRGYDVDGVTKCPPWKLEPFFDLAMGAMEAAMTREHEAVEDLLVQMPFEVR